MAFKQQTNQQQEPAQKPECVFRAGALSVTVWRRKNGDDIFFNSVPQRAFTRDDGATWEYSSSFNRDDLPIIAALLNQAFSFIVAQTAKA